MDAEKIIQDLNRRFAAPLPEFYKRRIVVWIDEDQEFVDKMDEISLGGAKVVALNGANNFYVKKLLAVDDLPVTIWCTVLSPMSPTRTTGFWTWSCTERSFVPI